MTPEEYKTFVEEELQKLLEKMNLHWGRSRNDIADQCYHNALKDVQETFEKIKMAVNSSAS